MNEHFYTLHYKLKFGNEEVEKTYKDLKEIKSTSKYIYFKDFNGIHRTVSTRFLTEMEIKKQGV